MSDLERRLTEALEHAARDAPAASGLAAAARARARRRRRTRVGLVASAAAAALAVPAGVLALGGDEEAGDAPPVAGSVAQDPAPDGYRTESWHSVSVEVPETWVHGSFGDWCAGGEVEPPRVSRQGVTFSVGCTPASPYGVELAAADGQEVQWPVAPQSSEAWPDGAFVGATTLGDVRVTVVARDEGVARGVLDSARRNEGLDPLGCPVTDEAAPVVGGAMTVCRYDDSGALVQSELLTGDQLAEARGAIRRAPTPSLTRCGDDFGAEHVRLRAGELEAVVDLACSGFELDGRTRALTTEVLFWALSPGWQGAHGHGVPMPDPLRE